MATVGELVVKIKADIGDLEAKLGEADASMKAFADSTDKSSGGMADWGKVAKIAIPIAGGLGVAALALTGNLGSMGAVLPIVTSGLGLLLAPLGSVLAIMVALIGPILTVTGLLGILAGAFTLAAVKAFGMNKDGLGQAISGLDGQFHTLISTLVGRFMPVFQFLIRNAHDLLGYFQKLSHMSLSDAFKSLSTTGVQGLTKFLDKVGTMLAHPIRLAFKLAFGAPGQGVSNALGGIWDQILNFFRHAPKGGVSIDTMMSNWFGAHDFTKTGLRWGMELAGAIIDGLGQTMKHTLGSRGIGFLFGGALAGAGLAAAFGPVGIGAGAAIGAGLGLALNHYWPQLVNKAKSEWASLWPKVKADATNAFHEITTALEHFLGPTTWRRIGTIAKNMWETAKTVAVTTFHAIATAGKALWQIFDTLVIKTGLWKVALALVKGVIYIIVGVLTPISSVVKTIIGWVVKLANHFNNDVLSAVQAVASVVGTIASDIETAVGWATKLASALGGIGNTGSGAGPGYGGARGGPRHKPAPGSGTPNVAGANAGPEIHIHLHGGIGDRATARRIAREIAPHLAQIRSVGA